MSALVLRTALFLYVASIGAVVYYSQPWTMFSLHPIAMALALWFFVEGILSFKITPNVPVHQVIVWLGILSAGGGAAYAYLYKDQHGRSHFVTYHGQIGLGLLGYSLAQSFAGGILYQVFKSPLLKKLHTLSGIIFFFSFVANSWLHVGHPLGWFSRGALNVPIPFKGWELVPQALLFIIAGATLRLFFKPSALVQSIKQKKQKKKD